MGIEELLDNVKDVVDQLDISGFIDDAKEAVEDFVDEIDIDDSEEEAESDELEPIVDIEKGEGEEIKRTVKDAIEKSEKRQEELVQNWLSRRDQQQPEKRHINPRWVM